MEKRFGYNLSRVRIHTDSAAADAIGAKAFASGQHIWFSTSHSPSDHQLLTHEVAHVVEQSTGGSASHRGPGKPPLPSASHLGAVTQFDFESDVLSELRRLPSAEDPRLSGAEQRRRNKVILDRRERLRDLFRGRTGKQAAALYDRLVKRKTGDALSERFHDILATPTRKEMLGILDQDILDQPPYAADFCQKYSAAEERVGADIRDDRAMNEFVDDWIAMYYGEEVADLLRLYLSGGSSKVIIYADPSSSIVKAFSDNAVTRKAQSEVLALFEIYLRGNCPNLLAGTWTDIDIGTLVPGTILNAGFSFGGSPPPTIPGLLAGGVSSSTGGRDSRSIAGKVQMFRVVENGKTTTVRLRSKLHIVVRDAFDFCPSGFMGKGLARSITIPLSRLEAIGWAGDVPFEVRYDGPTVERDVDASVVKDCFGK